MSDGKEHGRTDTERSEMVVDRIDMTWRCPFGIAHACLFGGGLAGLLGPGNGRDGDKIIWTKVIALEVKMKMHRRLGTKEMKRDK